MAIVELTLAFIAGGGIQALTNFLLNRRKENRLDMDQVHKAIQQDNERLRLEEKECRERVDALEQKVMGCYTEMLEMKKMVVILQSKLKLL